ncbi:MAG TPA: hypothetical protein DEQ02_01410 [Ruminococcaceae bacterium]|nr:hypothetical protein [Oscillospiraceae bacterium]
MTTILKKPSVHAIIRAGLLFLICIAAFAFPDFMTNGMVYVISGYLILNCALSVVEFSVRKREGATSANYVSLVFACCLAGLGLLALCYYRYVLGLIPLFLGVVITAMGAAYLAAAAGMRTNGKPLVIVLAVFIAIGGAVLALCTFADALGFDALSILAQIFGLLTLLSAICEVAIYVAEGSHAEWNYWQGRE